MKKYLLPCLLIVAFLVTSCNNNLNGIKSKECFYFEAVEPGAVIGLVRWEGKGTPPQIALEYSFDKKSWTPFVAGETSVAIPKKGGKLYIRATETNASFSSDDDFYHFVATSSVNVGGNIMYLLSCKISNMEFDSQRNSYRPFANLFRNMTTLVDASKLVLPAKSLPVSCYNGMFAGCTSLKSAPDLPATTLSNLCYSGMFMDCSSLENAPDLPATTLTSHCYGAMFTGCSSLKSVSINFTEWNSSDYATSRWLDRASKTGTFRCPSPLDVSTRDGSHVPEGWTVVNR